MTVYSSFTVDSFTLSLSFNAMISYSADASSDFAWFSFLLRT